MAIGTRFGRVFSDVKFTKVAVLRGTSAKDTKGRNILGPKREKELSRAMTNYNRRMIRRIKKYYGEVTGETIAKYARMIGEETVVFSLDRGEIKSVKGYNAVMKFLNRDKSKEYKDKLTTDRRAWLTKTLEHAYDMDPASYPEIFQAINSMSADKILQWATQNPEFVKKLFYQYEEVWDTETHNRWVRTVNELIDTLQPYTTVAIPYVQ